MSEAVSQTIGSTPYSRGDIVTSKDEERMLHGFRRYERNYCFLLADLMFLVNKPAFLTSPNSL